MDPCLYNWQPGTHLSIDTPTKSTGNTDNGLMKKLKEFDGLAMSLGNGNNTEDGAGQHKRSRSSSETEGSTDGSDGNTTGVMFALHLSYHLFSYNQTLTRWSKVLTFFCIFFRQMNRNLKEVERELQQKV